MLARILVTLLLTLIFVPVTFAAEHEHHHDATALVLNEGERWGTDESLRVAMERLHSVVIHAKNGHVPPEMLAERIGEEMQYMVEHCQLPPDADAELHKLLVMLGDAREKLLAEATQEAGLEKTQHVLELYGKYFAHEGWNAQSH